ncbi:MAG: S8 family serine peptidase [bacterium]
MKKPTFIPKQERLLAMLLIFFAVFLARESYGQNIQVNKAIFLQKDQLTSAQKKISSSLRAVIRKMEAKGITQFNAQRLKPSSLSNPLVKVDDRANIQSYIHLTETNLEHIDLLKTHQVRFEVINHKWNIIQAWVPFNKFHDIANLHFVKFMTPAEYAVRMTGSVNTEGDAVLRADEVRNTLGIDGTGVRIGVISDGVDSRSDAQATDDLPGTTEVSVSLPGSGDEGTAMLEIVHDLAPGAQLAFSGPNTSLEMVASINFLADTAFGGNGCDIIVDDLGFLSQPFFEDGLIAQAVDEVASKGVTYLTAAGNQALNHYEKDYVERSLDQLKVHDFGAAAGGASDVSMGVMVGANTSLTAILQWNDPFGGSGNDYDLFIFNETLDSVFAESKNVQHGNENPIEAAVFENTAGQDVRANIVISLFNGSPKFLELHFTGRDFDLEEYNVPEGSIAPGHQAANGAITVGAIFVLDPGNNTIESFSSRGPVRIFFPIQENRLKPDLAATDGNLITGAGGFGLELPAGSGNIRFFGTSSAAPHAAGVAALILSANPNLTPSEVRSALKSFAVDLGLPGEDNDFGAGRIDAFEAVQSVITSVEDETPTLPMQFVLEQNYPNPFNPTTTINYTIPPSHDNSRVKLDIYNTLGQKIRTLVNENQTAGTYQVQWDGKNDVAMHVSSGLYLYRLSAGSFVQIKKMLLLR